VHHARPLRKGRRYVIYFYLFYFIFNNL
jgi:hypothetical protein